MSAKTPRWRRIPWALLLFLAILLSFATPLHARTGQPTAGWKEVLTTTENPQTAYEDTSLQEILTHIADEARRQARARNLPILHWMAQSGADLQGTFTLTVPHMGSIHAIHWVIRRAGYQGELIDDTFFIYPGPDRRANLHELEAGQHMRRILILSLRGSADEADEEVLEFAEARLARSAVFRPALEEGYFTPNEYAALALLIRRSDGPERLQRLLAHATPAGTLYLQAGLHHLGLKYDVKREERPVPFHTPETEVLILESHETLYREFVITGQLMDSLFSRIPSDP